MIYRRRLRGRHLSEEDSYLLTSRQHCLTLSQRNTCSSSTTQRYTSVGRGESRATAYPEKGGVQELISESKTTFSLSFRLVHDRHLHYLAPSLSNRKHILSLLLAASLFLPSMVAKLSRSVELLPLPRYAGNIKLKLNYKETFSLMLSAKGVIVALEHADFNEV